MTDTVRFNDNPFNTEKISELIQVIVKVTPDLSGLDSDLIALSEDELDNLE